MVHCWSIQHWSYSGRSVERTYNTNHKRGFSMALWPRSTITHWNNILKTHYIHWNPPGCSCVALWKLCGVSPKPDLYLRLKNKDKCLFHRVTMTGYLPTQSCECVHTHTHTHTQKPRQRCQLQPATSYKPHIYADILCVFWLTVMGLCWHATAAVRRWAKAGGKAGVR